MLTQVSTKEAPGAIGPYSQAIRAGELLFTSGQIPLDPKTGEVIEGDIIAQAERVCQNIAGLLAGAGTSYGKVIKATCFLADMNDFSGFNEVFAKYFISKPARSTVAVRTLPKNVLCEVEVIAAVE